VAKDLKEHARTVAFMAGVTAFFIAAVSAVHLATANTVARNEKLFMQQAVLQAAGIEVPRAPAEVVARYEERVTPVPDARAPDYFTISEPGADAVTGYVFVREGAGLWGAIQAVVGIDDHLERITGASFVKHNETPGLGARIDEDWFVEQLKGKRPPVALTPEGTADNSDTEIDAITGATVTSTAVRNILNRTVDEAARKLEGVDA